MSIPEEIIENINYDETSDTQFAENQDVVEDEDDLQVPSSEEKRLLLKKNKNRKTDMVNSRNLPKD